MTLNLSFRGNEDSHDEFEIACLNLFKCQVKSIDEPIANHISFRGRIEYIGPIELNWKSWWWTFCDEGLKPDKQLRRLE